ncbi:MAG: TIGR03960 family B12-binding radical SAM protein [Candidatus Omnitrophica bacterium]|nr:TIGR03960 family B12-binding radical SAM protein [Candidatus Omnitrophota bacterium]
METKLKDMLSRVYKPGRYTGGETNSVVKEHGPGKVSIALAYPDMYEIGMSYLGIKILYHLLNERDDVVCERVFAPWPDMEAELRTQGESLFSLETRTPLAKFDVIGFSLSYELTYTNVLNILDLSGIPVRSDTRGEGDPIIIAGGASAYNPEPISPFIDAFLLGDGEEALPAFLEAYRALKDGGAGRNDILRGLARLKGVYVPSFYRAMHDEAGEFLWLEPCVDGVPRVIESSRVELENAYYPVKQIVPFIKVVHDRIAIEVMRGCPNACRFCQASAVTRPVRLRSPEKVRELCLKTYENTGYEQVSLLSLSSVNYPHIGKLAAQLIKDLKPKGIGLSIPSLKIDEAFYELPEMISEIRKAGLTFAPETASDETRKAIGKDLDITVLCRSAEIAYKHGWRRLKLYFMVGFPGEAEDEAERIISLAKELSELKKGVSGAPAEVSVSVNPFTPKPHTPFQWLGMRDRAYLEKVRSRLTGRNTRKVEVEFHDIDQSMLEAALSRGGRRTAEAVHAAWKAGSRMDSWREHFNYGRWKDAFKTAGLDLEEEASRIYRPGSPLPWGHILPGYGEEKLAAEFARSGFSPER